MISYHMKSFRHFKTRITKDSLANNAFTFSRLAFFLSLSPSHTSFVKTNLHKKIRIALYLKHYSISDEIGIRNKKDPPKIDNKSEFAKRLAFVKRSIFPTVGYINVVNTQNHFHFIPPHPNLYINFSSLPASLYCASKKNI
jgi:hypothetical protein